MTPNRGTRDAPLATLLAALSRVAGETEIRVAAGVYAEDVELRSDARVMGGYDGASWPRDPSRVTTTVGVGRNRCGQARLPVPPSTDSSFASPTGTGRVPPALRWGSRRAKGIVLSGNQILAGGGAAGANGSVRGDRRGQAGGQERYRRGPLHHPASRRRWRRRHQHDVHDHDPTHHRRDRDQPGQRRHQHPGDFVPSGQRPFRRLDREIVGRVGMEAAKASPAGPGPLPER